MRCRPGLLGDGAGGTQHQGADNGQDSTPPSRPSPPGRRGAQAPSARRQSFW
jgi:hypothetical protein